MPTSNDPYERMEFEYLKSSGLLYMSEKELYREILRLRAEVERLQEGMDGWESVEHYKWQEHINMGNKKPDHWQEIEITGRLIEIKSVDCRLVTLLPHGMGVFRRKQPRPAQEGE